VDRVGAAAPPSWTKPGRDLRPDRRGLTAAGRPAGDARDLVRRRAQEKDDGRSTRDRRALVDLSSMRDPRGSMARCRCRPARAR
jgi:hypothetical protein